MAERARSAQGVALCLQLLRAGLVGAHVGLVLALVVGAVVGGARGVANAAVAGVVATSFLAAGQGVQLIAAERADGEGMRLVLASYGVRVGILAVVLWAALAHPEVVAAHLVRPAFVAGALACVAGWVGAVLWRSSQQRVLVYDSAWEQSPTAGQRRRVGM